MIVLTSRPDGASRCRVSDAKFTEAETPGSSFTARSILLTHELQVIPEIEKVIGVSCSGVTSYPFTLSASTTLAWSTLFVDRPLPP